MADRGPVKIREGKIDALIDLYKQTYRKLITEITDATDAGKIQRARVLARINVELNSLGVDVNKWINEELPQYYLDGANIATQDLRAMGIDISKGNQFAAINREAIKALTDETALNFANAITGISRSSNRLLQDTLKQQLNYIIAEGKLTGATRKAISASLKERLEKEGLVSLTDRAGKTWSFDNYARMLARTKAVEARNQGLTNRMLALGYDLVQVTNHASEHPACAYWEGRIVSLTGKTPGYPTLQEAIGKGLFHPNCQHAINPINPKLAEKTKAYDNEYNKKNQRLDSGGGIRAEDAKQKAMEDALNRGDRKAAQKVINSVNDDALKAGLQSTMDALTGKQSGRLFVNPVTDKIVKLTPADDKSIIRTLYHGEGKSATPGINNMFGDAFYLARDEKTASIFGSVKTYKVPLKNSEILTIGNSEEYRALVDKAIAKYPKLKAEQAIPKFALDNHFVAIEAARDFDDLGGLALLKKSLIR